MVALGLSISTKGVGSRSDVWHEGRSGHLLEPARRPNRGVTACGRLICPMLSALLACSTSVQALDLADTIDAIRPTIVAVGTIQPTRRPPGRFAGTGFVVGDGRHVLTNAHVLPQHLDEAHNEFLALFAPLSEENTRRATVVGVDEAHDVALLRIEGTPLRVMKLGDSSHVREGDLYAFTGFPLAEVLGLKHVTHRAMISAITPIAIPQLSARELDPKLIKHLSRPFDVFQLDATAYPGNSGSPLYDMATGEVVGVLNMVFVKESKENVIAEPSGISYAIPIEYAKALLRKVGQSY